MKLPILLGLLLTMLKMAGPLMAEDSPVAVSIAVPYSNNERQLESYDTNQYFHVIISNTSDQPLRIWKEGCSWGYYGLSFELTDGAGKTWIAKKKPMIWTVNIPDFWVVAAHESLVLDVHFPNTDVWQGFPKLQGNSPTGNSQTFTMRAIFEFQPDDKSRERGVWTGRAVSKAEQYVFYQ